MRYPKTGEPPSAYLTIPAPLVGSDPVFGDEYIFWVSRGVVRVPRSGGTPELWLGTNCVDTLGFAQGYVYMDCEFDRYITRQLESSAPDPSPQLPSAAHPNLVPDFRGRNMSVGRDNVYWFEDGADGDTLVVANLEVTDFQRIPVPMHVYQILPHGGNVYLGGQYPTLGRLVGPDLTFELLSTNVEVTGNVVGLYGAGGPWLFWVHDSRHRTPL